MSEADSLAQGIATQFRRRMLGEYVPRIRRCVELLGDRELWRRPGPTCNSVANLLLHLRGNVTQWILHGLGGEADRRERAAEFAAREGASGKVLCDALEATVAQACTVVDAMGPTQWLAERSIQGYDETGLSAVLHVLEHFSGHAGQIYAWTKQVTDEDLRFYDL
ncbi:MAG: hypothetical protein RL398_2685 [Planctomycetota bacterium]|jgi:uncharacterized damage-inducible protein DinB